MDLCAIPMEHLCRDCWRIIKRRRQRDTHMCQISPPRPVNPVIGFKSLRIPGDGADTAVVPSSSSSSMMVDQQIVPHKANYTPIAWLCNIDNVKFNTSLSEKRMIFHNYSMTLQINISMAVVTLGDLVDLV